MPDLLVKFVNCPATGELRSNHGLARPEAWSLNHIPLRLLRYRMDLFQDPAIVQGRLARHRGRCIHTTDLVIRGVRDGSRAAAERAAVDVGWLLSFACLSETVPYEFLWGGHHRVTAPHGTFRFFRPVIDPRDGRAVREFLESVWPNYRRLKRQWKLPALINYLLIADSPGQPVEVKLVLISVILENIKTRYAKAAGKPFVNGFFIKPNRQRYGFEELLSEALHSVGMRRPLRRIIRVRNQIVHTGQLDLPVERRAFYFEESMSIAIEFVLRLLGFHGRFSVYRTLETRELG